MLTSRQAVIPTLVRVKPGALDRIGIYAQRNGFRRVLLFVSEGLHQSLSERLFAALATSAIQVTTTISVTAASFEAAVRHFQAIVQPVDAIIGLGGGKALDVAKYVSHLARLPYLAVPTSLSNDGISSPQSSLTVENRCRSLAAAMPFGVIIDTEVCLSAPEVLWHSGVGDLVSKFTAVTDWKLAFHAVGTPVDDFAALLSDASVYQFLAHPARDSEGLKLLGTALLLNGIAMAIGGSSRAASGSEHLISHALDQISSRPRLHGLQVGVATYLVSILQGGSSGVIAQLFEKTGFWAAIAADPFDRAEWLEAARLAPSIKTDFYTILSPRDCLPEIARALDTDPWLNRCFR